MIGSALLHKASSLPDVKVAAVSRNLLNLLKKILVRKFVLISTLKIGNRYFSSNTPCRYSTRHKA